MRSVLFHEEEDEAEVVARQLMKGRIKGSMKTMLCPDEPFPEGAIHRYGKGDADREAAKMKKKERAVKAAGAFTGASLESLDEGSLSLQVSEMISKEGIETMRTAILKLGGCASLLTRVRRRGVKERNVHARLHARGPATPFTEEEAQLAGEAFDGWRERAAGKRPRGLRRAAGGDRAEAMTERVLVTPLPCCPHSITR